MIAAARAHLLIAAVCVSLETVDDPHCVAGGEVSAGGPDVKIEYDLPTPTEYRSLRSAVGFGQVDLRAARSALDGSLWAVTVRDEAGIVGVARLIGDGALCFALADVLVHPRAQGRKVGRTLIEATMGYLRAAAKPGATVSLVAMPGREPSYRTFGFEECPNGAFGSGMVWPEPVESMLSTAIREE